MRWSLRTMKLLLAALLALGANGCVDEIDCFDGAGLEAKYVEGSERAYAQNTLEYEAGKTDGLSLTRADGEREGAADGYSAGFTSGYNSGEGYDAGYRDAYDDGSYDGSFDSDACSAGTSDGYAAGASDGYDDAFSDGYDDAYGDGYSDGASDGESACEPVEVARIAPSAETGAHASVNDRMTPVSDAPAPMETETVDPHEARVCYTRGYDEHINRGAYAEGLADGKRLNPEYQAGYRAAYEPAFAAGVLDGIDAGYSDGAYDGYEAGYADAAGAVYDGCYADGYADGYASGGSDGYDDGASTGYDDGYSDGWNSVSCVSN